MQINEKQTSRKLDELRRQDPESPIRNFPGSQHTGPGRTGLAASGGKPTTTKEEVDAFMRAQEGNILLSSLGNGYVFTDGAGEGTEIWVIGYDGNTSGFGKITRKTDSSGQEWSISQVPGVGTLYYPMGYPLPLLSTGHRHAAFQLTGDLVAVPKPTALPFMGEAYGDRRFVFYGTGRLAVVDLAGDLVVEGTWHWTKGRLVVAVDGDPAGPQSVGWRELAKQLGKTPTVWIPFTSNVR